MRVCAVIVIAIFISNNHVYGGSYTSGNELHQHCLKGDGYVNGFLDGFIETFTQYNKSICPPRNSNLGQAVDIYCLYLSKHPEIRHRSSGELAYWALSESWSCG
ncbi:Rap1a/Tai family immunity protein [Microbaculum sp. FT89]|uniref:Rap1a/Tai family immunity protein n=1 Tax=Microbaculum sp. FT89 TaxID=3447298 RepID=UPI003F531D75